MDQSSMHLKLISLLNWPANKCLLNWPANKLANSDFKARSKNMIEKRTFLK
jgi:hypothetical protein